jgi:uncharacterized RDD family membrane protein YckC
MTAYSSPAAVPGARTDTRVVGRRVVQYIVDAFLVGVLTGLCYLIYRAAPTNADGTLQGFWGFLLALVGGLATIAVWVWYWVLRPFSRAGQTFGMQLLGLRIIDAGGGRAGRGQLLVRALLLFVDTLVFGLVGLITMSATRNHQRVGDLVARTFVVRSWAAGR